MQEIQDIVYLMQVVPLIMIINQLKITSNILIHNTNSNGYAIFSTNTNKLDYSVARNRK